MINEEAYHGYVKHGIFNSYHEIYAILKEELDEFWQSVKENDPDPGELVQIAAVSSKAFEWISKRATEEIEKAKDDINNHNIL